MTTPLAAPPSDTATLSPARPSTPSLTEVISALHQPETDHRPWYERERWLVALLGAFPSILAGVLLEGAARTALLGFGAALIATGLALLLMQTRRP